MYEFIHTQCQKATTTNTYYCKQDASGATCPTSNFNLLHRVLNQSCLTGYTNFKTVSRF